MLTLLARLTLIVFSANQKKSSEYCNGEKKTKAENSRSVPVQLMLRAREKVNEMDSREPYPEPTLVPLGEKPKV